MSEKDAVCRVYAEIRKRARYKSLVIRAVVGDGKPLGLGR